MKKLSVILLVMILLPGIVFSQQQGNQGTGSEGTGNPEPQQISNENNASNQGENQQLKEQEMQQIGTQGQVQNMEQMQQKVQERKQEMSGELQGMSEDKQKVYMNQNRVREAVHNLLDMKGMLQQKGGIGDQVSEVAKQFNNSVQVTLKAEEKIQTRSRFMRLLVGGDDASADEVQGEVTRNREKIQQLKQLKEQIQGDEELKQMFQEQIQQMEQEQNRLQELAQKEKQSKGMFGWLFKK
jgi:hypothetical protein